MTTKKPPPSRGQDAIEAGAFGIFGTHIATGHEERQAQRQQSHLATPRRLEPVGPGRQKFVATRKKGTLGVDRKKMIENPEDQAIQLFKIAIPYPAVRVLSKGRIELLSSPQAKMNIFFTSMPSGHTNFS